VFESRVLRGIFGSERREVGGVQRSLHNEELHNFCSLPNIVWMINSRRMGWLGHVARTEEMRNEYKVLVEKSEEMRPLGR
jgi:hypothetical protein